MLPLDHEPIRFKEKIEMFSLTQSCVDVHVQLYNVQGIQIYLTPNTQYISSSNNISEHKSLKMLFFNNIGQKQVDLQLTS